MTIRDTLRSRSTIKKEKPSMQLLFSYLAVAMGQSRRGIDELSYLTGMDSRILRAHIQKGIDRGEIEEVETKEGGTAYKLKEMED